MHHPTPKPRLQAIVIQLDTDVAPDDETERFVRLADGEPEDADLPDTVPAGGGAESFVMRKPAPAVSSRDR